MHLLSEIVAPMRGAGPAGAGRPLLIGTPRSVRDMRHVLRRSDRPIRPAGCVLVSEPGGGSRGRPGTRVLGTVEDLERIVRERGIGVVYLSIPVAMHRLGERLAAELGAMGGTVRRLPTVADQLEGRLGAGGPSVDPAALLDRPARPLDEAAIDRTLRGKRVLITGAGGSIGSELARIVARFGPAELLLMERAENNLFQIDQQIAQAHPELPRRALLHDVSDARRTDELVRQHRPEVVFHAAAHKHVPMMEDHPRAALINNFFGTKAIADAAEAADAERFVMISTDKAVHPSSVMGATKRAAELYVQHLAAKGGTAFSMVRFGNVLGSACSVVPIWERQLAEGGPLTVTDPRMRRYFMTIPEAASLVIQAASLRRVDGSIFLLDMGEPVRIVDLAERFLRLNGLEPGRDAAIRFTGARPGEKLNEELAYSGEDLLPTDHASVRRLRTAPPDAARLRSMLREFRALGHSEDRAALLAALRRAVPEMRAEAVRPIDEAEAAERAA
jgi:FlaA1/EpsC-like NDP-sugar epimerase